MTFTEKPVTSAVSADGTPIGYRTSGRGRPLVLVHGGTADHTRWQKVLPALEEHSTVHAIDRRGRGASADSSGYTLEREFDDVVAVVESIAESTGGPVDLLGHSFGALCCLGAAARTSALRRVVLYEPAGTSPDDPIRPELIAHLDQLLAEDRRDDLLMTFFREVVQVPESELAILRTLPAWSGRVAAAHTLPRELRAVGSYRYDPARFAAINVPVLVLAGSESPKGVREICDVVVGALPSGRLGVLPGQQHIAMDTAPELFAKVVVDFLAADETP